jgi:hypothetical protein
MTDEEMAEQYAIENWEYYEDGRTDYEALKQAFLAGLKAGEDKAIKDLKEIKRKAEFLQFLILNA